MPPVPSRKPRCAVCDKEVVDKYDYLKKRNVTGLRFCSKECWRVRGFHPTCRKAKCRFCGVPTFGIDGKSACQECVPGGHVGRWGSIARNYNLSKPMYEALLAKQGGKCALCDKTSVSDGIKVLYVDHCHTTGAVRGLLCGECNVMMKAVDKENGNWLERAQKYRLIEHIPLDDIVFVNEHIHALNDERRRTVSKKISAEQRKKKESADKRVESFVSRLQKREQLIK